MATLGLSHAAVRDQSGGVLLGHHAGGGDDRDVIQRFQRRQRVRKVLRLDILRLNASDVAVRAAVLKEAIDRLRQMKMAQVFWQVGQAAKRILELSEVRARDDSFFGRTVRISGCQRNR